MVREQKIGIEEAGRKARYEFFNRAARQTGSDLIATAHTASDDLETIILNLARGAGMTGLRGISAKRGNLIRPLLCITKQEAEAYCREHDLKFLYDDANHDLQFARARVRHRILPELEQLNPRVIQAVQRMAAILSEEDDFLNGMAAAALEQSVLADNPQLAFLTEHLEVRLSKDRLLSFPEVLLKRGLRLASRTLGAEFETSHLEKAVTGLRSAPHGSLTAPDGLVILKWDSNAAHLWRSDQTLPFRHNLEIPGAIESDELGWKLSASERPASALPPQRRSVRTEIGLAELRRPLFFRSQKAGDKMQPLGFGGHRRVADLMSEAEVSPLARSRLPIVCDLLGPLWIPGVCLDQRAAPSPTAERVLLLQFEPV